MLLVRPRTRLFLLLTSLNICLTLDLRIGDLEDRGILDSVRPANLGKEISDLITLVLVLSLHAFIVEAKVLSIPKHK